ncbi:MAG: hypothetical protein QOG26_298 [Solirubrobacterales bacterium]|nr:hypothetical protein [Solirubrobacterales bacterium]
MNADPAPQPIRDDVPIWEQPGWGDYGGLDRFGLPGLELMRSAVQGLAPIPPIHYLTGMRPTEAGKGTAAFSMPSSSWLVNSAGLISAGVLCALADASLGCSVQVDLPPATPYTTAELSLTMIRPVRPGGTIDCGGQLIHRGRSIGISEAFVIDEPAGGGEGRLVAHSTTRCAILPQLDPIPEPPAELVAPEPKEGGGPPPYAREPVAGEVLDAEVWRQMSGREVLDAQIAGELPMPPLHFLTGLDLRGTGEGEATFALPATKWHCPPLPRVQGGFIAMVADAALQAAIITTTPANVAVVGLDIKVNFLRPVDPDGRELTARGSVLHRGRSIAIATGEVLNAEGKRVAVATGSAMLIPDRSMSTIGESDLDSRNTED